MIEVYTDGACAPSNPGPGGWAWAVGPDGERARSGHVEHSTNQRMELTAVLSAMQTFGDEEMIIVSDSKYVTDCFKQRWYLRWLSNNWRNAQGKPVANQDLWEPTLELYDPVIHTYRWVKGHSGVPMNEMVDQMANAAAYGTTISLPRKRVVHRR